LECDPDKTQSITSSNQQENNAQSDDSTNNSRNTAVAVTNPCGELDNDLLERLELLGITYARSQSLWREYDGQRLEDVLRYVETASLRNPAGFVIRALGENWAIAINSPTVLNPEDPGSSRYTTGRYAAFIEH
jgi:hypothetical protein